MFDFRTPQLAYRWFSGSLAGFVARFDDNVAGQSGPT